MPIQDGWGRLRFAKDLRYDGLNPNSFAKGSLEKIDGAADELSDVEGLRVERLPSGKRKQAARQGGRSLSAARCISQGAHHVGRIG